MPNIKVSLETYRRLVEYRRGMDTMESVIKRLLNHYEQSLLDQVETLATILPRAIPPQEKKP